jgi:hypothetical protein
MLSDNVWFAVALAVVSYGVGYYLAVYEAYLYYAGGKNYLMLEGLYDLTPALQEVASKGRRLTPGFLAEEIVLGLAVYAVWVVCFQEISHPEVFSFLLVECSVSNLT